jgi:hypothetical protein
MGQLNFRTMIHNLVPRPCGEAGIFHSISTIEPTLELKYFQLLIATRRNPHTRESPKAPMPCGQVAWNSEWKPLLGREAGGRFLTIIVPRSRRR